MQVRKLTFQCMEPSKYVLMSHSSMFASIVGFGPLCSQTSGWIKA